MSEQSHHPFWDNWTKNAIEAILIAQREARESGCSMVHTGHLLLGLLQVESVASRVLKNRGIDVVAVRSMVLRVTEDEEFKSEIDLPPEMPFSPASKLVLQHTWAQSNKRGDDYIGPHHLLLGLMRVPGLGQGCIDEIGRRGGPIESDLFAALKSSN
jgi:ATP-dependent Clp protease ATP-binding subunit ClpC